VKRRAVANTFDFGARHRDVEKERVRIHVASKEGRSNRVGKKGVQGIERKMLRVHFAGRRGKPSQTAVGGSTHGGRGSMIKKILSKKTLEIRTNSLPQVSILRENCGKE